MAPPKAKTTTKEVLLAIIGQVSQLNGGNGADKAIVASRAGYPGGHKTPAFTMAVKRCEKKNLLTKTDDGLLLLTDEGRELAGEATVDDIAPTNHDQHEEMMKTLGAKPKKLFGLLTDGQAHSRQELADAMQYKSPKEAAFTVLLGRVKKLGYIESVGANKDIQLTDMAFPYGRGAA
ncbi:MAG: hypothetical protein SGILL_010251, partial [Bacillariaceae sp.]